MNGTDTLFNSGRPFFIAFLPVIAGEERQSFSGFSDENLPSFSFRAELFSPQTPRKPDLVMSREEHFALISKTTAAIRAGDPGKVVISRIKRVPRDPSFSMPLLLERLEQSYPLAFVYCFRDQAGEMWTGASPELLLRRRGNVYQTVSLAGTQPWTEDMPLVDYRWGKKETEEQQIVTDFILSELRANGARELSVSEPSTVRAGGVVHLKSYISFESDLDSAHWLRTLHPTPAVCGFPRDRSLQFITTNEPQDRAYYSGYLGIQHPNGDADFFVNLRCMRVCDEYFDIFVGGGIMGASDADAEWDETEWKARTMLNLIP